MNTTELIRKKRQGQALSPEEIAAFVQGYTRGEIPDYQASALLMAIFFRGMDGAELAALTSEMLHSGDVLDLAALPGGKIDKHSTGGVGDKISLHLAPAVAACGVKVPMISGRGLGHTGGTLDKLEAIPGFSVGLTVDRFKEVLRECGLALIGQTERLAPADRKLYALRDVTATVESIPLIAASIMSKKLAEGADGFVFDVKVGQGAFMKDRASARLLGETLVDIARRAGKRATAFLTNMDQPLGRWVGNACEVDESLDVLDGKGEPDLHELTLALGGEMLRLGGAVDSYEAGRARIAASLGDGSARRAFEACVRLQGGQLPQDAAARQAFVRAPSIEVVHDGAAGFVQSIDAHEVGLCGIELGAGRKRKEDGIDPTASIFVAKKVGEPVARGEALLRFTPPRSGDPAAVSDEVRRRLAAAVVVGPAQPAPAPLLFEIIREVEE